MADGGGGVVPDRRGELWAFRSASRRAMAYAGEALQTCRDGWLGWPEWENLGRKAYVGVFSADSFSLLGFYYTVRARL